MKDGQQTRGWKQLLGVAACLCFVFQPLAVSLHLALENHAFQKASRELVENAVQSHSHSGHHHDRIGIPERREPGDHHPTHPAEDHLKDLPDPATSPGMVVLFALSLLPAFLALPDPSTVSVSLATYDAQVPLRPPRNAVASPRAPPVA